MGVKSISFNTPTLRPPRFKDGMWAALRLFGRSHWQGNGNGIITRFNITAPVSRSIVAVFGHNINGTGLPYYGADGSIVFADSNGGVLCDDYPDG